MSGLPSPSTSEILLLTLQVSKFFLTFSCPEFQGPRSFIICQSAAPQLALVADGAEDNLQDAGGHI